MLIVNSLNPPNRYGNIAVTRVLFIFEKKCTMSQEHRVKKLTSYFKYLCTMPNGTRVVFKTNGQLLYALTSWC
jgi:hypothetical protein